MLLVQPAAGLALLQGLQSQHGGIYHLGFDAGGNCECNYLSQLMHKHLGDGMYKQVATAMNDDINKNFEKANHK